MRALHTSDWHIGRALHGVDLLADQERILGYLADVVVAERIDVVFVSGDIYDRAVPSADAVRIATRALVRLRRAGAALVLISGNHDSPSRLGAFSEFAAAGGLHLRTSSQTLAEPVLLTDDHGDIACYGIPYLEPDVARHALGVPQAKGHNDVLAEAMRRINTDLATRPVGTRSVVLAHAFVTGATQSDSERCIAVGGVEEVPRSVFSGVDYVALGHLHGPQVLADHVRYSGSPLAYSFSEAQHHKSVWLLDFDATGLADVRRHRLPVPRKLVTISGKLDDLLGNPRFAELEECYLSITLTDSVRPLDAMRRLRDRFAYAVHLDWQPEGGSARRGLRYLEVIRGRRDSEIAEGFLTDCRGAGPNDRERGLVHNALVAADKADVRQAEGETTSDR